MPLTIAITGATGFIGTELVRFFCAQGDRCRVLVRAPSAELESLCGRDQVFLGTLTPYAVPEAFLKGADAVLHLASRVHQMKDAAADPLTEYRLLNRDASVCLAQEALAARVRHFVFFSTVKVMGDRGGTGRVFSETDPPAPTDPYDISKHEAEQELLTLFSGQAQSCLTVMRLPMVYGPGNKGNMLSLLKAATKGVWLPLGDARGKRSMVYVGNIAPALQRVVGTRADESSRIFYLTDGEDHSSAELYHAIFRAMHGKKGVFFFPSFVIRMLSFLVPRGRMMVSRLFDDYQFSSGRFCGQFGYRSIFSFNQGIEQTVAWYQKQHTK